MGKNANDIRTLEKDATSRRRIPALAIWTLAIAAVVGGTCVCASTSTIAAVAGGTRVCASKIAVVSNADFEGGAAGWRLKPAYAVQPGAGMNGSAGLVYDNADANLPYAFPTQAISLEPGETYRFSAWIRTEDIVPGKGNGAALAIEWADAEGHHLGGAYSAGLKGSHDWTRIEGVTVAIPEKAATFTVIPFCTPGTTGRAFFDDIEVAPYERPAVGAMLSSAYRNTAADGMVEFRVYLDIPESLAVEDVKAEFSHESPDSSQRTAAPATLTRNTAGLSIPVGDLKPGRSVVSFRLVAPDGATLGSASLTFNRVSALPPRHVWIDEHLRTIVDGEPFFPLGMFTGAAGRREDYVKGPFNCVMPYSAPDRDGMDFYWTNGVRVIYSVKDVYAGATKAPASVTDEASADAFVQSKVDAFRDHPGLLAWYVNDEFVGDGWFDALAHRRDFLERADPGHPTWAVVYQLQFLCELAPTFDIIGTDPYPVPNKPLSMAADWTRTTERAYFGLRPLWQVPQAFDWGGYRQQWPWAPEDRMPTVEEMRSMAWQCIAAGANGLVFYSFAAIQKETHGMKFETAWEDICKVGEEIRRYIPVLLSVEPAPSVSRVPSAWPTRVWRKDGETWLLVVNAQDAAGEAVLTLSEDFSEIRAEFGPEAEQTGPRSLRISLAPNQPALYRIL